MNAYMVKVGGVSFGGTYHAESDKEMERQIAIMIKQLHPINMSDEGATEYRKRYKGKPITVKKLYETNHKAFPNF